MIRRRDTAGKELNFLGELMNDPDADRRDVEKYVGSLVKIGQFTPQEALAIMRTLPETANPGQVRQWAQMMFAAVAHVGVHAHAAYPRELYPGQPAQRPGFAMSPTAPVAAETRDGEDQSGEENDEE